MGAPLHYGDGGANAEYLRLAREDEADEGAQTIATRFTVEVLYDVDLDDEARPVRRAMTVPGGSR